MRVECGFQSNSAHTGVQPSESESKREINLFANVCSTGGPHIFFFVWNVCPGTLLLAIAVCSRKPREDICSHTPSRCHSTHRYILWVERDTGMGEHHSAYNSKKGGLLHSVGEMNGAFFLHFWYRTKVSHSLKEWPWTSHGCLQNPLKVSPFWCVQCYKDISIAAPGPQGNLNIAEPYISKRVAATLLFSIH